MDLVIWIAAGAVLLALALYLAPARAAIIVDTPASIARAELRLLWGLTPAVLVRALPREAAGHPLAPFNDAPRIGHALMTPSLADAAHDAVRRLFLFAPRAARVELGLNLADSAQNRVVETAAQAAMAASPAALRDSVRFYKCEPPGAELIVRFDLTASPQQLSAIYSDFCASRPVREFRRRLRSKPKPAKKPVREVRAS